MKTKRVYWIKALAVNLHNEATGSRKKISYFQRSIFDYLKSQSNLEK